MISDSLIILNNELQNYLSGLELQDFSSVLGNFADLDTNGDDFSETIVQTLVRIEEETTLKNQPNNRVIGNQSLQSNPVIHLNLYVLFVSKYSTYIKSLNGLSHIIKFFQGKYHFNAQNSDISGVDSTSNDFKLWLNIHTPSFEEANHMWSILGGKQFPSVLYKVKMIAEERDAVTSSTSLITEFQSELKRM